LSNFLSVALKLQKGVVHPENQPLNPLVNNLGVPGLDRDQRYSGVQKD
jgi:hypothetical protein